MNGVGGEGSCFAPFVPLHEKHIQQFTHDLPTPREVDGVPGVYQWDAAQHKYVEVDHKHLCAKHGDECRYLLRALAIDVPVVTIRGSISPDVSRVYPPIPWSASNPSSSPTRSATRLATRGRRRRVPLPQNSLRAAPTPLSRSCSSSRARGSARRAADGELAGPRV